VTLETWARRAGIALARTDIPGRGFTLEACVERYLRGPVEDPNFSGWETELAYMVADGRT